MTARLQRLYQRIAHPHDDPLDSGAAAPPLCRLVCERALLHHFGWHQRVRGCKAQLYAHARGGAAAADRARRAGCHCVGAWRHLPSLELESTWNISFSALRHLHYAPALARAVSLARKGRSVGVLLCHFDFFLNVRLFHGAAYDQPWMPRGGAVVLGGYDLPVPRCYRVDTSAYRDDRSWFWFDRAKPRCRAAVRAMGGLSVAGAGRTSCTSHGRCSPTFRRCSARCPASTTRWPCRRACASSHSGEMSQSARSRATAVPLDACLALRPRPERAIGVRTR